MAFIKENKEPELMNDLVIKPLLKNSIVARELTSRIISNVMNVSYEEIYNNLKYIDNDRSYSSKVVDARTDIMVETDKYFINLEICYTNGINRDRQMDTYNYELYISQAIKTSNYKYMKQIVQIMIENYDYFHNKEFIYEVCFMEKNLHLTENNFITKYHINLDLLKEIDYNSIKYEKDALKKILYMFVCEKENLDKAYRGDLFMEKVIKTAKEIAGKEKIPLYLSESEIRRLDREEAVEEGFNAGIKQKQTDVVLEMYKNNIDIDIISKCVKLSTDEVKQIIKFNQE